MWFRLWPVALALLALIVRLALIARPAGAGQDLEIYAYFGRLINAGVNPYQAPIDGPIGPQYADMPPLALGLFAGILRIWDNPAALRIAFALAESAAVLLLAHFPERTERWRLFTASFLALSPLVLYLWTMVAEDKGLDLLLIVSVLVAVAAGRRRSAVALAALAAAYKGLALPFALPLLYWSAPTWRGRIASAGLFGALWAASHLAYFPSNLVLYQDRAERMAFDPPVHASPFSLLSVIGLYDPAMVKPVIVVALAGAYVAFFMRRLPIAPTIALSFLAFIWPSPEIGADRLLLASLVVLFVMPLTGQCIAVVWAIAAMLTVVLRLLTHGSTAYVIAANTMPAVLAVWILRIGKGELAMIQQPTQARRTWLTWNLGRWISQSFANANETRILSYEQRRLRPFGLWTPLVRVTEKVRPR